MARSQKLNWDFRPLGGGGVRIKVTFDQGSVAASYSQGEIQSLIEAMCQTSGLPEPWKKA